MTAFQAGLASIGVRRSGASGPAEPYVSEFVAGNYFSTFGLGAFVLALTLLTAVPLHADTFYSGAAVNGDGSVYSWGVTSACSMSSHTTHMSSTLTSPKGRQANGSNGDGCYTTVDLYLAFDPTDTGTYTVVSYSWAFCPVLGRWFWNGNGSQGSANNAYPVNFTLTGASDQGGGVTVILEADFSWQSSDGSLPDLSNCQMREDVTYPNTNNSACPNNSPPPPQKCYYPTSPPWPVNGTSGSGYVNPTIPTPGPATGGTATDLDSITNLAFVKPRRTRSMLPSTTNTPAMAVPGPTSTGPRP
jgi:hypothetical protein